MAAQRQYQTVEKEYSTEAEYFEFERKAIGRWEYVNGEIRQMAGGADDHNTIVINVAGTLRNAMVPRGCRVYGSDMKIHTGDGNNTFPDVAVVCGPRRYHGGRTDVISNPLLIVEVLSPSTAGYDRGEKFDHYRTVPTLTDYLLVSVDEPRVSHYSLRGGLWVLREVTGLDAVVTLPSIETTLALADIYALIDFEA